MKFSELSKGQKRCALALIESNDKLKSPSKRMEIVETWNNMRDAGSKVGFPNWLLTSQFKNAKGLYVVPKPTAKDIEEYKNPVKKPKIKKEKAVRAKGLSVARQAYDNNTLSQEDMQYYNTLEKYGIAF